MKQARIDLAAALRAADREGLGEGVCNHFSFAVPGTDNRFLINPNRKHWSEVRASDLALLDNDGALVEGDMAPEPTAFYIHWRIHVAVPQARCVLHTHMPYTTALTMLEQPELLPLSQSSLMFYDRIGYDRIYNGLAADEEEGDRIAAALGNRAVLFMSNHGVTVTGATVAEAWNRLYYLERAAMHQVMALSTGRPLKLISEKIARQTVQQIADDEVDMAEHHFAAVKRMLDRDCPDYAE